MEFLTFVHLLAIDGMFFFGTMKSESRGRGGSIGFDVDVLTKLEISGLMIEIDVDWTNKQTNEKFVAENFSIRVKSVIAHKVSSLNALCSPYHITKSIKLKALAGCGQTMWKVQLQCDLVCLFEIDAAAYCVYVFRVS